VCAARGVHTQPDEERLAGMFCEIIAFCIVLISELKIGELKRKQKKSSYISRVAWRDENNFFRAIASHLLQFSKKILL